MSRARKPVQHTSDWGAWFPVENRDAEVEQLREELAASQEREREARRETEQARERFKRLLGSNRRFLGTLRDRRAQQITNQKRLVTQHAIDSVLDGSGNLADAAPDILRVLGENLGWHRAVLWIPDEATDVLRCGEVWQRPGGSPDGFEAACRGTSFLGDEGIPGRAWSKNRVVWTRDLESEAGRAEAGMADGMRGALAFPISAGGRSFGVVELLDEEALEPDEELSYTAGLIGTRIGNFVERREAEEQLEQSRRLFRRIADASPDILYLYDLGEERNVYVNPGVERVLGYTPEQVAAMGDNLIPHLLHPGDFRIAAESVRTLNAVEEGEVNETEYRMRHADGTYRWLCSHEVVFSRAPDGRTKQVLGLAQDVTESKEAAAALAEGEERLRLATEAGRVGLLDWDLISDASQCSGVMAEIFGHAPGEYNPSYAGFLEHVHPEDRGRVRSTLDASISAGEPHEPEFRIVRPDGEVRHVRSQGRVHQDEKGVPVRVLGITQDITEQKRAEEERDRLRALEVATRAEAAERERISRELHDRVAHSMGVVHQSLQLYGALENKAPEKAQSRLHTAKETARTALEQTRNLSAELRRSETEEGLIPALQNLLEVAVPEEVHTELHASGEEALLSEQQRGQLYQILREAIRNSIKHSGCENIKVGLQITPEEFLGYVEDDGRGFKANNGNNGNNGNTGNGSERGGLGVQTMGERANLIDGRTQTYTPPEGGAGVEVRVPIHTRGGVIWQREEMR